MKNFENRDSRSVWVVKNGRKEKVIVKNLKNDQKTTRYFRDLAPRSQIPYNQSSGMLDAAHVDIVFSSDPSDAQMLSRPPADHTTSCSVYVLLLTRIPRRRKRRSLEHFSLAGARANFFISLSLFLSRNYHTVSPSARAILCFSSHVFCGNLSLFLRRRRLCVYYRNLRILPLTHRWLVAGEREMTVGWWEERWREDNKKHLCCMFDFDLKVFGACASLRLSLSRPFSPTLSLPSHFLIRLLPCVRGRRIRRQEVEGGTRLSPVPIYQFFPPWVS